MVLSDHHRPGHPIWVNQVRLWWLTVAEGKPGTCLDKVRRQTTSCFVFARLSRPATLNDRNTNTLLQETIGVTDEMKVRKGCKSTAWPGNANLTANPRSGYVGGEIKKRTYVMAS